MLEISTQSLETEWDLASVATINRMGVAGCRLYQRNIADTAYVASAKGRHRLARRRPLWHSSINPPVMRLWFAHVARQLLADVILMTSACWDGLVPSQAAGGATRVINASDILTKNRAMRETLAAYVSGRVDELSEGDEA